MLTASWSRIFVLGTPEEGFSLWVLTFVLEEEDKIGLRLAQAQIQVIFAAIILWLG